MPSTDLANEWSLLQAQCDGYEKYSLLIKLVAAVLLGATLLVPSGHEVALGAVIGVLWLQDAIWKTFQQRIETRLLQLERYLAAERSGGQSDGVAYQLNTEFQSQRQRGGVVKEYLRQAVRPTVAYPYAALLVVLMFSV
ncbi:MAG: hypothetical protein AB8G17_04785 [Gammaproteobacteria bacterium]